MNGPDAGTLPILLVIEGGRSGERIAIPEGTWSIGRDPASDIVLEDAGVSRRHATLTSDGAGPHDRGRRLDERHPRQRRAALVGLVGSPPATRSGWAPWRSGRGAGCRRRERRPLAAAGRRRRPPVAARLRTRSAGLCPTGRGPAGSTPAVAAAPRRGRVRLGRVVLVGALANLVLLVAAVVIEFATDWTGIGPWLAAPLLGMVAALVDVAQAGRDP